MKKLFKFITIAVLFLLSLSLFAKVASIIGKGCKSQMAKVM